jgi:hypothetical protein
MDLVTHVLHISFTASAAESLPALSLSGIVHGSVNAAKSTLVLFSGAADAGKIRELFNLLLLAFAAAAFLVAIWRKWLPRRLALLLGSVFVIDEIVYILSGQAVQADTSRYLIMLAPAALVAVAAVKLPARLRTIRLGTVALAAAALVLAVNFLTLGTALARSWDTSIPKDAHLESVYRYASAHPNIHIYASDDTALPISYYHNLVAGQILPVVCSASSLAKTHHSMESAFAAAEQSPERLAAIVLDGTAITNVPNICSPQTISRQFGPPLKTVRTDDGSQVLIYRQSSVRLHD